MPNDKRAAKAESERRRMTKQALAHIEGAKTAPRPPDTELERRVAAIEERVEHLSAALERLLDRLTAMLLGGDDA